MNASSDSEVKSVVRQFILEEFLYGEDPAALEDSTNLRAAGILDSIATVRVVAFLEERFGVEFEAHEMGAERLSSVSDLVALVMAKRGAH